MNAFVGDRRSRSVASKSAIRFLSCPSVCTYGVAGPVAVRGDGRQGSRGADVTGGLQNASATESRQTSLSRSNLARKAEVEQLVSCRGWCRSWHRLAVPLPLSCATCDRCSAPRTGADACRTRLPRSPCPCKAPRALSLHMCAPHANASFFVVARVADHWLTIATADASSTETRRAYARHHPLLASHMHRPHPVHATHHHAAKPLVQT